MNADQLNTKARAILDAADDENRPLTRDERVRVQDLLERRDAQRKADSFGRQLGPAVTSFTAGPGEVFVRSEQYQRYKSSDGRPQRFSTGPIQISEGALNTKGTLTEVGAGGPGGGLVPAEYRPGIVEKLFEAPSVGDLFASSTVTGSQIRYVVEGTATSGAAGVAELGAKPESTLGLSEVVEPIRKIATTTSVSDELFEDAPSVSTYISSRLSLFVKLEEERQLLRGSGTNEVVGIFGRGISIYSRGTADPNEVALLKAASGVRGSAHLDPTGVVLHPDDYLSLRLIRDNQGQYMGGGPFTGQYGQGGQLGFSGANIWGMPIALSSTVGKGTALIGCFKTAAEIYRRGGVSVEATNSHADNFTHNITQLRAEQRLGLACYRPSAFVEVRGLS